MWLKIPTSSWTDGKTILVNTSQHSHHSYRGIYHTGAPTFVYLCHRNLPLNVWSHEVTAFCNSPSLWKRFPATGRRFRATVSKISGGIDQRVSKLWSAGAAKLLASQFPSVLASGTVDHYDLRLAHYINGSIIYKFIIKQKERVLTILVRPSVNCPHHRLTILSVIMLGPYMWNNCWRMLLSVQKPDNRMNLAVGVRQYQCNTYCRHKTGTALHYSYIFPLYC